MFIVGWQRGGTVHRCHSGVKANEGSIWARTSQGKENVDLETFHENWHISFVLIFHWPKQGIWQDELEPGEQEVQASHRAGRRIRVSVNSPKLEMQLEGRVRSNFLKVSLQNTQITFILCFCGLVFFSWRAWWGILRKKFYLLLATPLFYLYVSSGSLNNAELCLQGNTWITAYWTVRCVCTLGERFALITCVKFKIVKW